jgi:hypothetical protein
MGRRTAPKRLAPCRCGAAVRAVAQVAKELRDFPASWRAVGVESWSESDYAIDSGGEVRFEDRHYAQGAGQLAHCADVILPELALELEGRCQDCARAEAARLGHLRKLVFVGVLADFRASGRDERAEEEFELLRPTPERRCAA